MTEDETELAWLARERPFSEGLLETLQGHPSLSVQICDRHGIVRGDCEDCGEDPLAPDHIEEGGLLVEFVVVASILRPNGLRATRYVGSPALPEHTAKGLLMGVAEELGV